MRRISGRDSDVIPDEREKSILRDSYFRFNSSPQYADYPSVSYEAFYEDPENLGCMMAGNSQLYIDTLGNVQPCVFLPLSFGNILKDDLSEILSYMRSAIPGPLRTVCPAVILGHAIKSFRDRKEDIVVHYHELTEEFEAIAVRRANL
jgi:MoaA/NifB/PqqE/SkfB family radical SAM enzyme